MHRQSQRGAAAVEMAIVFIIFTIMLFGAMEMGRLLWTWNAATEATRLGARMAIVCDLNDPDIIARMRERLPALTDLNIEINYLNPPDAADSCTTANCKAVEVLLKNYKHETIIPFLPLSVTLPSFQTTLRKEYMQSSGNPVCN